MPILLILFYLALIILSIWVWYLISKEFYKSAVLKGFPQRKYLWLTFFLGLLGILLILSLPDRGQDQGSSSHSEDDLPPL